MPAEAWSSADVNLPLSVETMFAWAIREGVTNVVRYSGARTCTIELQRESEAVVLTVTDDGRGIASAPSGGHTAGHTRTGLLGLAERAAQMHGDIEAGPSACADGSEPTGYRLRVRVPLAAQESRPAVSAVDTRGAADDSGLARGGSDDAAWRAGGAARAP